jgi:hypothetical protein
MLTVRSSGTGGAVVDGPHDHTALLVEAPLNPAGPAQTPEGEGDKVGGEAGLLGELAARA